MTCSLIPYALNHEAEDSRGIGLLSASSTDIVAEASETMIANASRTRLPSNPKMGTRGVAMRGVAQTSQSYGSVSGSASESSKD